MLIGRQARAVFVCMLAKVLRQGVHEVDVLGGLGAELDEVDLVLRGVPVLVEARLQVGHNADATAAEHLPERIAERLALGLTPE